MDRILWGLLLLFGLACAPALAWAKDGKRGGINPEVLTEGFLAAHPDLRWRKQGMLAYEKQDYPRALEHFKRAAHYADKPSQAMVAEMYWQGIGAPGDRVLGYIWSDLAGERLYPDFIAIREHRWSQLDESERSQAIERGQAILDEYGDAAAKPRLERVLRSERRRVTGSRVGFVGAMTIIPMTGPLAGTGMTLSGDEYYAKKYWEPSEYWRMQDEVWRAPIRGRVRASDLQPADSPGEEGASERPVPGG